MEFISTNGIDLRTGRPVFHRVPFQEFLQVFHNRLPAPREDEERRRATTSALSTTRSIFAATTNLNDPVAAGYGVVCAPGRVPLLDGALAPLLAWRQVKPEHRLVLDIAQVGIGGLSDWMDEHITFRDGPYYWLLVGGPAELPFDLQWMLDAGKAAGRIEFDDEAEYAAYAERVIRAEQVLAASHGAPPVFFWSTLHDDVTRLSNWYMCTPLVKRLESHGVNVTYREKADATVDAFWSAARAWGTRGGLVYTASHGGMLPNDDAEQPARQGALVAMDGTIEGQQVDRERSAFPHSVVFNFACYSGGTPSHSDFNHWVPEYHLGRYIPQTAFVSRLHRRWVAHPAGPLAAVGHVEPAWLHSFANPDNPDDVMFDAALDTEWGERIQPFRTFTDRLVRGYTVGYAMELFGFLYDQLGNDIARRINRYLRDNPGGAVNEQELRKMATRWISRNDYQNYVVFGDPAVRIA
ncbi:MAG: hypothetical protein QN178_01400 [Armatimonadota bacterium]|nr:hypothetical protein [Armatimonadota bacterium]